MNIDNICKLSIKEIKYNFKNYWFLLSSIIIFFLNFIIVNFGEYVTGDSSQTDIRSLLLSIIHLQMYLIPLLSLILSYDSILSEREFGVLDLMLSYKISFMDILFGKLIGNTIIFSLSFCFSFIIIGVYLYALGVGIYILIKFIFVSMWLSFIFNTMAICISTLFKDRTLVISLSIFIWLFFIFIYDILFTFLTVIIDNEFLGGSLIMILFLNPAEIFRLISIYYFMPLDINELFGINVGFLDINYIMLSVFFWILLSLICLFFIKDD